MTWIITSDQVNPPGDAAITYDITNAGRDFNLRSTGTVDYEVEWGDGAVEISTVNTLPHTYAAGDYTLGVYSDGVYRPYFNNVTADASQITSVVIGSGANLGTDLTKAWRGATNMASFVCPFDVTSGVADFKEAWRLCNSLTSFPLIDTSSGTNFSAAWHSCSSLTSFPLLNTSSSTNFGAAWYNCRNLTSFPSINTSLGTNFGAAWQGCNSLTSFPLINTSSGTDFTATWQNCSSLTSFALIDTSSGTNFLQAWRFCASLADFPANMFDTTGTLVATAFANAWNNCALTAQSIENILVSLDTNGATGITLSIDGGTNAAKTTWSAAAVTAYDNLIVKGWTISFNA